MAAQCQQAARLEEAHQQQRERVRSEAALCARQFGRVDPDNRLVAAALERRWEVALRALQTAEAAATQRRQPTDTAQGALAPE